MAIVVVAVGKRKQTTWMVIIIATVVAVPITMKSPPLKVVGKGQKCNWFNWFYDCSVNFYNHPGHIRGPC